MQKPKLEFLNKQNWFIQTLLHALLAFAIYQLVLLIPIQIIDRSWFNPWLWNHWDTGHYLSKVRDGNQFYSCAQVEGFMADTPHMCGNAGWFPGYSYLLKPFYPKYDLVLVASIASKIFFFLSMVFTARLFNFRSVTLKSVLLMSIAAFTFGSIYYQGIFPMSMFLTFALVAILGFVQRKLWMMIVGSVLACFTYSTGFLLPVAIGIGLLLDTKQTMRKRLKTAVIVNVAGALSVLTYFLILQIEVGDWQAFIKVQSVYGHGIESPIKRIGHRIENIPSPLFQINNTIYLQSFLVLLGYLVLSVLFWWKRKLRTPFNSLIYAYVSLYVLFPWTIGGNLSMCRAESLLLPSVFLLRSLNVSWLMGYVLILIAVWIPMSYLFFISVLV